MPEDIIFPEIETTYRSFLYIVLAYSSKAAMHGLMVVFKFKRYHMLE